MSSGHELKAVVGLGNPGRRYVGTRHNVGFDVLEELAGRFRLTFKRSWRLRAYSCNMEASGRDVLLVKPQGYMNRSGETVAQLPRRRGLTPEEILVVVDDVALELGRIRIRGSGGAGGHNGLKSIIAHVGSDAFPRMRVGIGGRSASGDLADHVLSRYAPDERLAMREAIPLAVDAVLCVIESGVEPAMNKFNAKTPE